MFPTFVVVVFVVSKTQFSRAKSELNEDGWNARKRVSYRILLKIKIEYSFTIMNSMPNNRLLDVDFKDLGFRNYGKFS
jgi:hypothetical protein